MTFGESHVGASFDLLHNYVYVHTEHHDAAITDTTKSLERMLKASELKFSGVLQTQFT